MIDIVFNQPLDIPSSPAISPELRDLILRCLEKDAKRRIKIQEVKDHPWFNEETEQKLVKQKIYEKKTLEFNDGVYDGEFVDGKRHGKNI